MLKVDRADMRERLEIQDGTYLKKTTQKVITNFVLRKAVSNFNFPFFT